jgi:hypothetical protein
MVDIGNKLNILKLLVFTITLFFHILMKRMAWLNVNIYIFIEIDLTFLCQGKAPLKIWSYAFETSVYFINCIPTLVLNHKTLFCISFEANT